MSTFLSVGATVNRIMDQSPLLPLWLALLLAAVPVAGTVVVLICLPSSPDWPIKVEIFAVTLDLATGMVWVLSDRFASPSLLGLACLATFGAIAISTLWSVNPVRRMRWPPLLAAFAPVAVLPPARRLADWGFEEGKLCDTALFACGLFLTAIYVVALAAVMELAHFALVALAHGTGLAYVRPVWEALDYVMGVRESPPVGYGESDEPIFSSGVWIRLILIEFVVVSLPSLIINILNAVQLDELTVVSAVTGFFSINVALKLGYKFIYHAVKFQSFPPHEVAPVAAAAEGEAAVIGATVITAG